MKKSNLVLGLTAALLMTTAHQASATSVTTSSDTGTARGTYSIEALDTDRNGTLSETELSAHSQIKANEFSSIDKNGDGSVDAKEYSNWQFIKGKGTAAGSSVGNGHVSGTVTAPNVNTRVNGTVGTPVDSVGVDGSVGSSTNTRGTNSGATGSMNR